VAASSAVDADQLLEAAQGGDRAAVARLLTMVERGGDAAAAVDRVAFGQSGRACTVGLTGAPGAGKSTLVSGMIGVARRAGHRVGVLAVDPSSPFTGGAILGDRVRMGDHALDDGVFIRSMATRGHLGGLAVATPQAARVLDAAGCDRVVIETVGVGQVEVEVAGEADITVVVVNPGWGDAVQANKAGLMEIADLFVINKADRTGTAETRADLEQMLALSQGDRPGGGRPAGIVTTIATTGEGVAEAWSAVEAAAEDLRTTGVLDARRRARTEAELHRVLGARLAEQVADLAGGEAFRDALDEVQGRRLAPWDAADRLVRLGRVPGDG
jgi:LAO/AO transport system kinase